MGIPYIAICVIIIVVYVNLRANRAMRRDEDSRRSFWAREHKANATRKQSLDDLNYIEIPPDIPPEESALPERAKSAAMRIVQMREEGAKIVNLTGYTNTDLKLMYGTANITHLMEYDAHYTLLATCLHDVGKALYEEERFAEAERILSFAAQTGSDITGTYRLLIDIYRTKTGLTKEEAAEKTGLLLPVATSLRSLSKDGIVRLIQENI